MHVQLGKIVWGEKKFLGHLVSGSLHDGLAEKMASLILSGTHTSYI